MPRLGLVALCAIGIACSVAETGDNTPATIVYDGAPTDEALAHMNSLPRQPGPPLTILSPTDGASLDPIKPTTIVFAEGTVAYAPRSKGAGRSFPRWVRFLDQALGIGPAKAHGAPYNGTAYLLEISDATGKKRLQIFTDQASVTVAEADWSDLASAPGPLQLAVVSATFEENLVTADGGPFERAHASFSIQ